MACLLLTRRHPSAFLILLQFLRSFSVSPLILDIGCNGNCVMSTGCSVWITRMPALLRVLFSFNYVWQRLIVAQSVEVPPDACITELAIPVCSSMACCDEAFQ